MGHFNYARGVASELVLCKTRARHRELIGPPDDFNWLNVRNAKRDLASVEAVVHSSTSAVSKRIILFARSAELDSSA